MNSSLILLLGIVLVGSLYNFSTAYGVESGAGKIQMGSMELTDRLIVKLRTPKMQQAVEMPLRSAEMKKMSALAGISLSYLRPMSGHAYVLKLPYKMTIAEANNFSASLARGVSIEYAAPDAPVHAMRVPNDPLYAKQWHYHVSSSNGMNLPGAWAITTGAATTVTAVIDSGILPHTDLDPARILPGYDFIVDIATANDGDGRDPDPTDPGDAAPGGGHSTWHGTHIAGTIAAWTNNGIGVAGIDWRGKLLPLRVLGVGGGWSSDVVDAIVWAAGGVVPGVPPNANPADVINMSLGGAGACNPAWQNAIDTAVAAGATIVVSAGNSSADAASFLPASCNKVITVAAHNNMGAISNYSNFGPAVEIMAPGGEQFFSRDPGGILSTLDGGITTALGDNIYALYQGTSMAAPHISGLVALLLAANPSLTPAQISTAIQNSSRPFNPGGFCVLIANRCGAGIADAQAALLSVTPLLAPSNQSATAVSDTRINLSWIDNASNEVGFKLERKTGIGGTYVQIATVAKNVTSFTDSTGSEGVTYYYRIKAYHAYAASAYSNDAFATTFPVAPSGFAAASVSAASINLTWTDNSAVEKGFKVERSTDAVSYTQIAITAANITSYDDAGLAPFTTYYYRVRAFQTFGNSLYSSVSQATTGGRWGGSFDSSLLLLGLLWIVSISIRYRAFRSDQTLS